MVRQTRLERGIELTEHKDTSVEESSSEELDDLFLSPEDSEGELIAEVDTSGDVREAEPAEQDEAEGAAGNGGASREELDAANTRIGELEAERDDVKNRMMRVAADLENFRKRAAREREDMRKYGIDKVVLELLPVLDNLERALQHAEANAEDNSITEGVRMVYRQFVSALNKHGVQGFDSKGEPFDPQRHEAIQQVETDEYDNGTVMEEYQRGYFLHDRLIRPAMVSVAKNVTPVANEDEDDDHADNVIEMTASDAEGSSAEQGAEETAADEASHDGAGEADDSEGLEESTDVGM
jgi:molecular chaperone GrpE